MIMMADSDESIDALFRGLIEQLDADCASDSPDMQSVRSNLISSAATDPPDVDAVLLELHACTPSGRPRISEINDSLLCEMTPNDVMEPMLWAASLPDEVTSTDDTTDTVDLTEKKDAKKTNSGTGKRNHSLATAPMMLHELLVRTHQTWNCQLQSTSRQLTASPPNALVRSEGKWRAYGRRTTEASLRIMKKTERTVKLMIGWMTK